MFVFALADNNLATEISFDMIFKALQAYSEFSHRDEYIASDTYFSLLIPLHNYKSLTHCKILPALKAFLEFCDRIPRRPQEDTEARTRLPFPLRRPMAVGIKI
jgi:hypothetical protein